MSQKSPLAIAAALRNDDACLSGCFALLVASRWQIGGTADIVVALGVSLVFIVRPVHQANTFAQGVDHVRNIDPESALGKVSKMFDVRIGTQIGATILQSRVVFETALDEMGFDTKAKPACLSLIRNWLAQCDGVCSKLTMVNVSVCGRGDEHLNIYNFFVIGAFVGMRFALTSPDLGCNRLKAVEGRIGLAVVLKQFDSANKLRVDSTDVTPGTKFVPTGASLGKLVECPQKRLNISQKDCADTGIISTSLGLKRQSGDGTRTEIGNAYINENWERKAEKSLAFPNDLLLQLMQNLECAQGRYHALRNHLAACSVDEHGKPHLSQGAAVRDSLLELKRKRAELYAICALAHLAIQVLDQQIGLPSTIRAPKRRKALPHLKKKVVRSISDENMDNELLMTSFEKTSMAKLVAAAAHLKRENARADAVIAKGPDADACRYCWRARIGLYRNASYFGALHAGAKLQKGGISREHNRSSE